MSEVVTAEQIEAFRTNGFVVVDDLLTDAELDTFEPLVTAAVAYRSAGDERTLEEGGAGGSPVVPAATHAVDENDVLDLGHTTKGDSHSAQASPKRVCRLCRQRVGLSGPASAPAPPFELVGYRLNTRHALGDSAPLPESAVAEEHGAHRIWEGRVQRAGNHRRRADDTNVAGPLAHGRVAGAGALIDRPRRCGRGDRGQSDRRRGCGRGE
jgi:hypothetical protein